ncbi:MAG: histidine phosphatase family protein, partial [Xanthomonas perforans]|nr:histidine phosphatase family protein [Xanthomonas perforans]
RALQCLVAGSGFGRMTELAVPHASLHPLAWPPSDAAGAFRSPVSSTALPPAYDTE